MANGDIVVAQGNANRALPSAVSDGVNGTLRMTRRGEMFTHPVAGWRYALSDEGTYFVAHNNTIDLATTLAGHPAPVLADIDSTMTKPLVHMMHSGASTSQVRVYLDFIEIEVITAGANGTSSLWSMQLDTGTSRYSSGTVETFTSYSGNMQSSATSILTVKGGPFVATAEGANVRRIGHGVFKPTIELQNDRYMFSFGQDPIGGNRVNAAATIYQVTCPPVILGPTDQLLLAIGQVAQDTAGVYKVRCGWWER